MSVRIHLSIVVLFTACSVSLTAQDRVQWKFATGQTLNYLIQQKMETSTRLGQQIVKQNVSQNIDMSWKTLGNGASGAVVEQVFKRVRLRMEGGGAGTVEFDSDKPNPPNNPVLAAMAKSFSNIVGQAFQLTMTPNGTVSNVTIPKQLLDAVKDSQAGREGVLTEQMLKDMMKKSAVMLPAEPVAVGDQWKTSQVVDMPYGTMTVNSEMTYAKKEDGIAIINFVPTVTIQARDQIPVKVELTSAAGRGQIKFDLNQGVVNTSILELKLEMAISTNGQKIPQTIHNLTAMTLKKPE